MQRGRHSLTNSGGEMKRKRKEKETELEFQLQDEHRNVDEELKEKRYRRKNLTERQR